MFILQPSSKGKFKETLRDKPSSGVLPQTVRQTLQCTARFARSQKSKVKSQKKKKEPLNSFMEKEKNVFR